MSIGIIIMGILIGFMVGLTGVGGAALLTPILILLGISPSIAVGTDLFYNSITKFFGSIQHWRQKTINLQLVKISPSEVYQVLSLLLACSIYLIPSFIIKSKSLSMH